LYIVDSANGGENGNQVIVYDPSARAVVRTIPAGYGVDAAVSPDGSHLFVTQRGDHDTVDVVRTSDWQTERSLNVDGRLYYIVYPPEHWMKVSADGKTLYFLKYGDAPGGCGDCNGKLGAVDVEKGEPVLDLPIAGCSPGSLDFYDGGDRLYTSCSKGDAGVVDLTDGNFERLPLFVQVQTSALDRAHSRWYFVTKSTQLYYVDVSAGSPMMPVGPLPLLTDAPSYTTWGMVLSPDGSRLYLAATGTEELRYTGQADEIWGFDTTTWSAVMHVHLDKPSMQFAVSGDGSTLYSVDPGSSTLTLIDTKSGNWEEITGVGGTPAKVLVGRR
jgi:YVTN family beta-propeller protein